MKAHPMPRKLKISSSGKTIYPTGMTATKDNEGSWRIMIPYHGKVGSQAVRAKHLINMLDDMLVEAIDQATTPDTKKAR